MSGQWRKSLKSPKGAWNGVAKWQLGLGMTEQLRLVNTFLDELETQNARLQYAYETQGADGVKHSFSLPFDPYLSNHQQISAWELMVFRRCWAFGVNNKDFHIELVCCPIPTLNTNAGSQIDAAHRHPTTAPMNVTFARAANLADHHGYFRMEDGAKSCKRKSAHESGEILKGDPYARYTCQLHGNHLCMGLAVGYVGIYVINALYKLSLLLCTGGYFLRITLAVRVLVEKHAKLINAPCSADERLFCLEVLKTGAFK